MDKVTVKELSDGWAYLINGHQGNNNLYHTESIATQMASKYLRNKYFSQSDSVKFGSYQVNIIGGNRHYTYYVNQEGSKEIYTFKTLYKAYKYVWNKLKYGDTTKVNSKAELPNFVDKFFDTGLWDKMDFIDQVQHIVSNPDLTEEEKVYSVVYISQKAPKTRFDK